jgi:hypothetical protein
MVKNKLFAKPSQLNPSDGTFQDFFAVNFNLIKNV